MPHEYLPFLEFERERPGTKNSSDLVFVRPILSIFPGIDLLGRAFELEGACVVRGPDPIFGGDIANFDPPPGVFEGVIGGPPCQDFSKARRCPPTGDGMRNLAEFVRVVAGVSPDWFLMENVPAVPSVQVPGYVVQRFNVRASDVGCRQTRNRCFQFGSKNGMPIRVERMARKEGPITPAALASEGKRANRRSWSDFCELQGLPADFELPGWTIAARYRAVGNGVPLPLGRALAIAVRRRAVTPWLNLCICECGRTVTGNQKHATPACRKRMERKRRASPEVSGPGSVTPATSQ